MRTRAERKFVAKATALGARVPQAELFVLIKALKKMGREYFLHGQFPAGLPSGQEHNTDVGGQSDKAPPETFRIDCGFALMSV